MMLQSRLVPVSQSRATGRGGLYHLGLNQSTMLSFLTRSPAISPSHSHPPCVLSLLPGQWLRSEAGKRNGLIHYFKRKAVKVWSFKTLPDPGYLSVCSSDLAANSQLYYIYIYKAYFKPEGSLSHTNPPHPQCYYLSLL